VFCTLASGAVPQQRPRKAIDLCPGEFGFGYASMGADMKIGIIGAGHIGGTLARRLTALGHDVLIANSRGPESLANLAAESGATAVSVPEAAGARDLVIVTIPEKNVPRLRADLFEGVADDLVVVDTGNYYPQQRDGRIEEI
jgi:predicted dinucleotide-binding enzyme